ncbi:MAG: hypothetical protein ACYDA8_22910 [Deferrisomatales bacterium]
MAPLTPQRLRQGWVIAFLLGAMMINFPFLQICNRPAFLFGVPLLYLYLFVGWGASIGVIAFYAWALGRTPPRDEA